MSHRVIQADSVVSSESKAAALKTEIKSKLDQASYELNNREVNDGSNLQGEVTLAVKTQHSNSTESNDFYNWLWSFGQNNQASYNQDGEVTSDGFERFRIQVHDCKHLAGLEEPCEIGNADKYDLR